ncbi:MAG: DUF188 domain-containing protein [Selenomonas sp.]|uniref:DUF188 domain-containing protein n=1 Tax=Selenomonas sp. TaxID=2053611 RepID=UPI0025FF189D|nr:DUF188 domain-containing protein [Selenomonas sp.]MCI6100526.1 DUF188 domain-containing protein [Selenomonas sp.]MCI6231539.1 DUF188 domain-containing protein [Selenomonas sp.]
MRSWKDADAAASFRSDADASLFSRVAAALWGWNLVPAGTESSLPFPVFFEHRQMFFPIASFADAGAQSLAVALFAWFDRSSSYPTTRSLGCYAPLQMTTKTFLEEFAETPELPQPYDIAERFIEDAIRQRPLDDVQTELETFLATTDLVIHRRDILRWKDIFHLVIQRAEAAQDYVTKRRWDVTDAELQEFLEVYRQQQENHAEPKEDAFAMQASIAVAPPRHGNLRRLRKVLVDADACPVIPSVENICERYGVPVVLCCDDSRAMESSYSDIVRVPRGQHAADAAIIALCHKGDIVVTEDAGLALLALAKEAYPIASDGWRYTHRMLRQKDGAQLKRRSAQRHLHKRTSSDDEDFERGFLVLLHKKFFGEEEW